MVKLSEVASFNRKSLLPAILKESSDVRELQYPGDNYLLAARMVWSAMRSAANRQVDNALVGDDGRHGQVLTGMDIRQTIQLLWPDIDHSSLARSGTAIRRYLAGANNVRCIRPTRGTKPGAVVPLCEWWIANEWESDMSSLSASQREASARHARHIKGDHSTCLSNRPCRRNMKSKPTPSQMPPKAAVAAVANTTGQASATVPVNPTTGTSGTTNAATQPVVSGTDTGVDAVSATVPAAEGDVPDVLRTLANGHRDDPFVFALIEFAQAALTARRKWEDDNRDLRRKLVAVRSAFAALGDIE